MNKLIALLALSLLPLSAAAVGYSSIALDKSGISFVSTQMNVPMEGKFGKFTAQLDFNPANPEAARAQVDIDVNSIDVGSSDANDEAKSKDWFNVKVYPAAKFVSSSLKPLGGGRYQAMGKLTIKGQTHDVSALFTVKPQGAVAAFDGGFAIKRLQFGIGEGIWTDTETVADEVQIRFHLVATATK